MKRSILCKSSRPYQALLFTDSRQVTHDLDGSDVAGEDDYPLLALPDASLYVLEAVAHVGLVLHALLDALVKLEA